MSEPAILGEFELHPTGIQIMTSIRDEHGANSDVLGTIFGIILVLLFFFIQLNHRRLEVGGDPVVGTGHHDTDCRWLGWPNSPDSFEMTDEVD